MWSSQSTGNYELVKEAMRIGILCQTLRKEILNLIIMFLLDQEWVTVRISKDKLRIKGEEMSQLIG